jgi:hypothetical protein
LFASFKQLILFVFVFGLANKTNKYLQTICLLTTVLVAIDRCCNHAEERKEILSLMLRLFAASLCRDAPAPHGQAAERQATGDPSEPQRRQSPNTVSAVSIVFAAFPVSIAFTVFSVHAVLVMSTW